MTLLSFCHLAFHYLNKLLCPLYPCHLQPLETLELEALYLRGPPLRTWSPEDLVLLAPRTATQLSPHRPIKGRKAIRSSTQILPHFLLLFIIFGYLVLLKNKSPTRTGPMLPLLCSLFLLGRSTGWLLAFGLCVAPRIHQNRFGSERWKQRGCVSPGAKARGVRTKCGQGI